VKRTGYDLMKGSCKCEDELQGSIKAGDFFFFLFPSALTRDKTKEQVVQSLKNCNKLQIFPADTVLND
jgi:hypothetical protein